MASSANYAAMNYGELLNTKTAYSWAIGYHIDPLIKAKRLEEMVNITRVYVTAMNGYDATREEILACLETVGMNENHMLSFQHKTDEKTPPVNVDTCQATGERTLSLPEPGEDNMDDIDVNANWDVLAGDATQEDEDSESSSSSEGEPRSGVLEEKDSRDDHIEAESSDDKVAGGTEDIEAEETTNAETRENTLVEEAIEMMRALPAPEDVNVNAPYYVEAIFAYGDTANPGYSNPEWRNMGRKDLEDFRDASLNYEKLFLKHEVVLSTDDYLIVNESMNSIKVRMYHFPEGGLAETEAAKQYGGICYTVNETEVKEVKFKESLLKKAIKKAKEISSTIGVQADIPFYDRFTFKKDYKQVELRGEPRRFLEDAENLPIIMSSFETYARLLNERSVVLSKDNCVAATALGETIYVVLFNIPVKKEERKARRKSKPATNNTAESKTKELETGPSSAQSVKTPILKAVEMTKTLPLGNDTDDSIPYFVQRDYFISEDEEVIPKGRPFSKQLSDDADVAGLKKRYRRFAKTMKASAIVSTDEYTAYIWNEGRSLTVFYYNTNTQAETAN